MGTERRAGRTLGLSGSGGPGAVLCSSFTPVDTKGHPWWGRSAPSFSLLLLADLKE